MAGLSGHPCPTGLQGSSRCEWQLPLLIALTGAKQVKVGLGRTGHFWLRGTARRKRGKPRVGALSIGGCAAAGGGCAGSPGLELRPHCSRLQHRAPSAAELRRASGRPLMGSRAQTKRLRRVYPQARRWRNTAGHRSHRRSALRPLAALGLSVRWGANRARARASSA